MKHIILLLIAMLASASIHAQQLDHRTKNVITAKFLGAKDNFEDKEYDKALKQIEELTGKPTLATALDLKVQILLALNKITEHEKELDIMMGMQLSGETVKNVSTYNATIAKKRIE